MRINDTPFTHPAPVEVQVKTPKTRRSFSPADKKRLVEAYDACSSQERGSFLRQQSLYHSTISDWKKLLKKNTLTEKSASIKAEQLARENEKLKKRLAEAETIIDLQKKISSLFGLEESFQKNSEKN